MEMQVIKKKPTLELQQDEETLRVQLFALRIQKALGKLEAPHMINNLRKDIARIKTELSLRSLNGETIKPLNINKMVLVEDKKEIKKTKKTAKVEKKATKAQDTNSTETVENVETKEVTKAKPAVKKVATNKKTVKPKTTAPKSASKTSSSKKTTKPQEDKA
ncbi:50S ribosomal protein L29 [Spiroplasma endosymbiont of Nebria brevicollis]|uniref:50S ribosomal protein L29 n=1 Tax=Spiroplasma endosymbiont of Nebria brevicollis TaxID=3066284 RepID=UPI00313C0844